MVKDICGDFFFCLSMNEGIKKARLACFMFYVLCFSSVFLYVSRSTYRQGSHKVTMISLLEMYMASFWVPGAGHFGVENRHNLYPV